MIKKLVVILAIVGIGIIGLSYFNAPNTPEKAYAMMCFKTGERVSGLNKICFYKCGGSDAAITVGSYELCPLTIDR